MQIQLLLLVRFLPRHLQFVLAAVVAGGMAELVGGIDCLLGLSDPLLSVYSIIIRLIISCIPITRNLRRFRIPSLIRFGKDQGILITRYFLVPFVTIVQNPSSILFHVFHISFFPFQYQSPS